MMELQAWVDSTSLSILYLRCRGAGELRGEARSEYLSILYLRCCYYAHYPSLHISEAFNSLFEMQTGNVVLLNRLRFIVFQFSI